MKEFNKPLFRNKNAKQLYEDMRSRTHVIESGTDNYGYIYFHWANGNTDRYSRRGFLKMANSK